MLLVGRVSAHEHATAIVRVRLLIAAACRAAVPVAAYLGAPFDDPFGKPAGPAGYIEALDKYMYGTWDEGINTHSYSFEHEPLSVTLEHLENEVEVLNRCVFWPVLPDVVNESHFCSPLESISVHVFVTRKLAGFELRGSGMAASVPKSRSSATIAATDIAYKGQFQRLLKFDSNIQEWEEQFVQIFQAYMEVVDAGQFAIERSAAPLKKVLAEALKRKIKLPDGGDAFTARWFPAAASTPAAGRSGKKAPPAKKAALAGNGRGGARIGTDPFFGAKGCPQLQRRSDDRSKNPMK